MNRDPNSNNPPDHSNTRRRPDRIKTLSIRQQNLNRSQTATLDLMNDPTIQEYDIIAIQEPHLDWRKIPRIPAGWHRVYPTDYLKDGHDKIRSCIWINGKLHNSNWENIDVHSTDVSAMTVITETGIVLIFNLYVDIDSSACLQAVEETLATMQQQNKKWDHMIWLGDFNRHHPRWDDPRNAHLFTTHNLDMAEELIEHISKHDLSMALEEHKPTLCAMSTGNLTRPDNVFLSSELFDRIVRCTVIPEERPTRTDHFPIETILEVTVDRTPEERRYNFRETDWENFRKELTNNLSLIPTSEPITNIMEFQYRLNLLEKAMYDTISRTVPGTRPSPFCKRWWNKELTKIRKEMRHIAKDIYGQQKTLDPELTQKYKTIRNLFSNEIKKAKREAWEEFLDSVDEKTVWTAKDFVTKEYTDGARTRVPKLKQKDTTGRIHEFTTSQEKSDIFHSTFFNPSETPKPIPPNQKYPEVKFLFIKISDEQILRVIKRLRPHKAPGMNGVPNVVIKESADLLLPIIGPLFRATFELKYIPPAWKDSKTVIVRKPGKPSYENPNAYRPIALLDTLGKVLAACVAEDITQMSEKYNVLPPNHFGGRPGRTTTDAIHYLQTFIKDAWRQGQVTVALFLDIKGAFPSISLDTLIHDMRKRGVPAEYTTWIDNRVRNRRTCISFDGYISEPQSLDRGIDQGGTESANIFPFYNADILEVPDQKKGEDAILFMDDTTLLAKAKTVEDAVAKIQDMMTRPNGVMEWAKTHGCAFALDKFALVAFTRRREMNQETGKKEPLACPDLVLQDTSIKPTQTAKFLGITLDQELRFKEHTNAALAKGVRWIEQFRRLSKTYGGVSAKYMKCYYNTIALPRILYVAENFLIPRSDNSAGTAGHINKLTRIHRQAAILITGAFRTTATDMLLIHADLLPFDLIVKKRLQAATLRLATLPKSHPLHKCIGRASRRYVKHHRHAIHELFHTFQISPDKTETIQTVTHGPKWQPPHKSHISKDKQTAIEDLQVEPEQIWAYSDGSVKDNGVGAAAVLYRGNIRVDELAKYLGTASEHTIFDAEVTGVILATHLLKKHYPRRKEVNIALDNQSTIMRSGTHTSKSGQSLVLAMQTSLEKLKSSGMSIKLAWVPGHMEVIGNEDADKLAKKAAAGESSNTRDRRNMLRQLGEIMAPASVSAMKQKYSEVILAEYKDKLTASPRFQRIKNLEPNAPTSSFHKTFGHVSRKALAILTQLRTEHAPVNKYLHRIGRSDTSLCPECNESVESVKHLLVDCDKYEPQRIKIKTTLKRNARNVPYLLSNPKAIPLVLEFIGATGRFAANGKQINIQTDIANRIQHKTKKKTEEHNTGDDRNRRSMRNRNEMVGDDGRVSRVGGMDRPVGQRSTHQTRRRDRDGATSNNDTNQRRITDWFTHVNEE